MSRRTKGVSLGLFVAAVLLAIGIVVSDDQVGAVGSGPMRPEARGATEVGASPAPSEDTLRIRPPTSAPPDPGPASFIAPDVFRYDPPEDGVTLQEFIADAERFTGRHFVLSECAQRDSNP